MSAWGQKLTSAEDAGRSAKSSHQQVKHIRFAPKADQPLHRKK